MITLSFSRDAAGGRTAPAPLTGVADRETEGSFSMGVPGIAPHDLLVLLTQLSILLGLAYVLGRAAVRTGTPPVTGELLAGVVAGPSLLGAVAPGVQHWIFPANVPQTHMLAAIAQFGALLLVGMTGVEVDLALVRGHRRCVTAVSVLGLILPVGLGVLAGFCIPSSLRVAHSSPLALALFVGTAVGISSIPVVAKILAEMHLLHRTIGQVVLMSAAVGDIVAWVMLSVVAALAVSGAGAHQAGRAGLAVACVFIAAVALRPVLRRAISAASASGDRPTTAVVVITVLGGAAGSQALSLEPVFGAFIAGVVIGTLPELDGRHLEGLRVTTFAVLAPIYLASAGLHLDLTVFGSPLVLMTLVVLLAVAVSTKLGGAYAGARMGRMGHWDSLAVAAGMNARGLVGIVAADVGMRLGLLSRGMYAIVVAIAVLTSIAAPPLMAWSVRRSAPIVEGNARMVSEARRG